MAAHGHGVLYLPDHQDMDDGEIANRLKRILEYHKMNPEQREQALANMVFATHDIDPNIPIGLVIHDNHRAWPVGDDVQMAKMLTDLKAFCTRHNSPGLVITPRFHRIINRYSWRIQTLSVVSQSDAVKYKINQGDARDTLIIRELGADLALLPEYIVLHRNDAGVLIPARI